MESENKQSAGCCCGSQRESADGLVVLNDSSERTTREEVSIVQTRLTMKDRLSGWAVRWGIGRSNYGIAPGLYAVGAPNEHSTVLVTANYKLSFDSLRKELGGLDAWILVLDTRGINVWCAAGKGTFGTEELVRRIQFSGLHNRVSHRNIVLPQLGAPGVAAHVVKEKTGFRVIYGPVRAGDIKPFLAGGMKATREMRQVNFGLAERLAVVPVELVVVLKYFLLAFMAWALWKWLWGDASLPRLLGDSASFLGALLVGTVAVPALLPWIPFRSFALKGWLLGGIWALAISLLQEANSLQLAGNLLLLPAVSAFLALNFTGCTTYTSQTGVNKEIRQFARPMAISGILGIIMMAIRFIR